MHGVLGCSRPPTRPPRVCKMLRTESKAVPHPRLGGAHAGAMPLVLRFGALQPAAVSWALQLQPQLTTHTRKTSSDDSSALTCSHAATRAGY